MEKVFVFSQKYLNRSLIRFKGIRRKYSNLLPRKICSKPSYSGEGSQGMRLSGRESSTSALWKA